MKSEDRKRLQPSRQLARSLRTAIECGQLRPGDKLPSERNLADTHRVARNTAREAVRILADEGLVTVEHGRGAFVRVKPRLMRFGASRYSKSVREATGLSPYRAEVKAQGKSPSVNCVSITRVAPPGLVAERLGISLDSEVVRRENRYFADDEPMQIGITYIPVTIAGDSPLATSRNLGPGSLYARFADQGYEIALIHEEISARMPTENEISTLQIPGGTPLLEVIHTGADADGRPFEITIFTMRADTNGLDYTISVEP